MSLTRPATQLPSSLRRVVCLQCRSLHKRAAQSVPAKTPFVPDTEAFLTLIGRKSSQFASKIPSWDALFTLSSEQLRASGIEPARARRYLLWWRDRYRKGVMGIGGDLKEVKDGVAELRVVQIPSDNAIHQQGSLTRDAGMRKVVVNVPVSLAAPVDAESTAKDAKTTAGITPLAKSRSRSYEPISGIKLGLGDRIAGRGVEPIKGHPDAAKLRVQEGLWEQKRGHKVDGGERRKAEVRFKRRQAERKAAR